MTTLHIYKEADQNCSNALMCLSYGHYIMGRKRPITSYDPRISKKHALITVHQNGARIEALHKNPTFIKSSSSGKLIKLSKNNEPLPLNNNDLFSLLSKSIWYRVKLIQMDSETTVSLKRNLVEDTSIVSPSKRIKIDNVEGSNIAGSSTGSQRANDAVFIRANDVNCFAANELDSASDLECTVKIEPQDINSTENVTSTNTNRLELENNFPIEVKLEPLDTNSAETTSTNQVEVENNPSVTVKLEPPDSDSTIVTNTNRVENNLPVTVKVEPQDVNSNNPTCSTNGAGVGSNPRIARVPPWKIEHPDWRRDRCWYGSNCYRRNPLHKEDFSHPGDDDYDSDHSDNRPMCVYGQYCYRLNILHRREFKHHGKPANRPVINVLVRQFFQNKSRTSEHESDNGTSDYDSDVEQ